MPKRVAVVDLGSNSVRMAIFERTSRLGFYILREYKIKVRLGEGAYENGGVLRQAAMDKAFNAFKEFKHYINAYKVNRVICVGTSALRDAPNAKIFMDRIRCKLGLNLKIIDGKLEAFYGAVAATNLLSPLSDATTIDIGGGSTELAKIENGKIINTLSLDIGTVRLKELFFDKRNPAGAAKFIDEIINKITPEFSSTNLIAIGGSLRAISNSIMIAKKHPLRLVHNFSYSLKDYSEFIRQIISSTPTQLKNFPIKKDRYDTIRGGAMIFLKIADKLGSSDVYTSGAGVREGIFLTHILRPAIKFPHNFNPSLKSLQDRFMKVKNNNAILHVKKLFEVLKPLHGVDDAHLFELVTAAKVYNIGRSLWFYSEHVHSGYMVKNGLNFGYTHAQKTLIAAIIEFHGKSVEDLGEFADLLPKPEQVQWLSFMLSVAVSTSIVSDVRFSLSHHTLRIGGIKTYLMAKDEIKKLPKPAVFAIMFD